MSHPFDSARRKLARARHHVHELERAGSAFFASEPYIWVAQPDLREPHLDVHKLRFSTTMPDELPSLTADALHNLRDALDNAGYALAVSAGKQNPLNSAFPFAGSAADFDNALGRCKDIPEAIQAVFRAYGPYRGGNNFLWALNRLAVTDKHKLLTIAVNSQLGDVHAVGAIHHIPVNPVWDASTREIEVFTGFVGHPLTIRLDIGLYVAFYEVEFAAGEPVLKLLDYYLELVGDILQRLDQEARQLGIFA